MIKTVLSGIFYPMAILRYFEAALKRRSDIELVTIGPYTRRWIPWNKGMWLKEEYAIEPTISVPGSNTKCLPIQWAEQQLPWEPDLWIQIDAGFHWKGKPTHGLNTIVATDPHVLNYNQQRRFADVFFCMQRHYSEPGDVWLPYAYDPIWHQPSPQEKVWDACLLGLHYPQRDLLVGRLKDEGFSVNYGLGPCFEEAQILYGQARVGLNWSSHKDLNARVFEILAMGLPLVTNRVPDMGEFFSEGKSFLGFDSVEEALNQVFFVVGSSRVAEQLSFQGLKAVEPHTYDARIQQILEEVGLNSA